MAKTSANKLSWSGVVTSVQPRIRLMRSFDQRQHAYPGYVLQLDGQMGEEVRAFSVAIGNAAHEKHKFRIGMTVRALGVPIADSRLETAELYKVSGLKAEMFDEPSSSSPPPWIGVPPALSVYRQRGHRRLDVRRYGAKCTSCIWGCRMPVEMTIDHWNPGAKKYRFETFCYGPKSCSLYSAGPTRKVPGRKGMSWEEEDGIDEEATGHRAPDE